MAWYTIEVPIPREIKQLAEEMGVEEHKLVKAIQRLIILEVATLESKLTKKDALKLADELERSAWKNSR